MPRVCTVCTHAERLPIERALVRREPYRRIAPRYGLSERSLRRHVKEHLADRLKKAHEHEDVREALDVVAQLKAINGASLSILKEARQMRRSETALKAIDRIHRQIVLQLRITENQEFEERLEMLESTLEQRGESR